MHYDLLFAFLYYFHRAIHLFVCFPQDRNHQAQEEADRKRHEKEEIAAQKIRGIKAEEEQLISALSAVDARLALSAALYSDYTSLSQVFPRVIQYEGLTNMAVDALRSSNLDRLKSLAHHRSELKFTPERGHTVDSLRSRLSALQAQLTERRRYLVEHIVESAHIGYAVSCTEHLQQLQTLLDLQFVPSQYPMTIPPLLLKNNVSETTTALTAALYSDYTSLSQVFPRVVQYEGLTNMAVDALRSSNVERLKSLAHHRSELKFTPERGHTVDSLRSRLSTLQAQLTERRRYLVEHIVESAHIGYAVSCTEHLQHLQTLLDLQFVPSQYPVTAQVRVLDIILF